MSSNETNSQIHAIAEQLESAQLVTQASSPSKPYINLGSLKHQPEFSSSRRRLWGDLAPSQRPLSSASSGSDGSIDALLIPLHDWKQCPINVMSQIVAQLSLQDVRSARLVCKEWHEAVSASVAHLRPRSLTAGALPATFPALQRLELKGCRRILDQDLAGLKHLITLRVLSFEGCDGITDATIETEVAVLPKLRVLSLKHCVKLTDYTLWLLCGVARRMLRLRGASSPMKSPRRLSSSSEADSSSYLCSSNAEGSSKCPPLESLDLSGCVLMSEQGFDCLPGSLTQLTELRLGGCSRVATVSDAALVGVGKCTRLQVLDLSGCCNLTSDGLSHLSSLKSLKYLNLWNCMRLTPEGLGALSSCTALKELSLRGCQPMDDESLRRISAFKSLKKLDMRACEHLRGEDFVRLSSLGQLTELNLWGCYALSDVGLTAVGVLRTLKVLRLNECWQITNNGLAALSRLTSLEELDLAGCRNLINAGVGNPLAGLHAMQALKSLTLRGCDRLSCGALGFLSAATAPKLKYLDLSGCRELNGEGLLPLQSCKDSLNSLKLQHCVGLRGPNALVALEQLASLTYLHLGGCTGLTGTALASLAPLASLQQINLEGCSNVPLLDKGLVSLGFCCNAITTLSLQGCNTLTDEGLAALGRLPVLETINLSDCSGIKGKGFEKWIGSPVRVVQLQGATSLTNSGVAALASSLVHLKDLSLKHCRGVTDEGALALAQSMPCLTSLSLQGMIGLTDDGVSALSNLRTLNSLELQFCWQFGDEGACELTALTNLTNLDLMYSWKVTDVTMRALGMMRALRNLNMMGCHRVSQEGKAAVAHLLGDSSRHT